MRSQRLLLGVMVLATVASLWPGLAVAGEENYPTRKITYLLVFDPGGQSDIEAPMCRCSCAAMRPGPKGWGKP